MIEPRRGKQHSRRFLVWSTMGFTREFVGSGARKGRPDVSRETIWRRQWRTLFHVERLTPVGIPLSNDVLRYDVAATMHRPSPRRDPREQEFFLDDRNRARFFDD